MQKFLRTLALMALMLVPWVTQAQQTLTVYETATGTNEFVPFYGWYADETQQNQMIYPASELSGLVGQSITQMVFYVDHVSGSNDIGNWIVSLGETSSTTLSDLDNSTTLTQVYSGAMTFNSGETMMTVTFDDGYIYNGGNLLVEFNHPVTASYKHYFFIGETVDGASYCYDNQRNFLPKVTFTYETPATCAKPTGLAVNYAGGTEATISWTSEATAWNISVNGVETAITTNPYTLTNLSLSTTYEVMVQADCGSNGTSNWTNAISFTTPDCWGGHLIEYSLTDNYNDGWEGATITVEDACGNVIETLTTTSGTVNGTLSLCGDFYKIVYHKSSNYNNEHNWTFTEGGATIFSGNGDSYSGSTNELIGTLGTISCPAPTDLATDELTTSTAVLSWTENGTATAWQLCVNGDEDHLIDVTTNPYTLNNLDEYTPYTVKLRANCGESQSCWTDDFDFTTLANCPAPVLAANGVTNVTAHTADVAWTGFTQNDGYNIRYQVSNSISEGFENGIPEGWTVNKTSSSTGITTAAARNGSQCFRFYYGEQNASLVSPVLSGTENGVTFSFYYRRYNNSYTEGFRVGYNTDGSDVFTYGDEISSTNMDWLRYETSFPAGTKRVAIQYVYHDAYYLYIDDIEILIPNDDWTNTTANTNTKTLEGLNGETTYLVQVQGVCGSSVSDWSDGVRFTTEIACPATTDLVAGIPTPNSVELSWTENGTATAWQLCINGDEEHLRDVTTNPFTLEGLNSSADYTVKVRANCGGIDGQSVWSNEVSFTTQANCPVPVLEADGITNVAARTADVAWTGFAQNDSYNVIYRSQAYIDGLSEEFATTSVPTGWTRYTGLLSNIMSGSALTNATSGWTFGTGNGVFDSHARVNIYGNYQRWLVTPVIEVSNGFALNFDMALTVYTSSSSASPTAGGQPDDKFVVLISNDNMATWTILRQWDNAGSEYVYDNIPNTGENVTIDLTAYSGQNVNVAFYGESTQSNGDNNLHIDNVAIGRAIPAGDWQTATVSDASTTLTNLIPETPYEVKVQGICGGEPTAEMSAVQTFTTLASCMPVEGLAIDATQTTNNSITLTWNDSYNSDATYIIYKNGAIEATGVQNTSYTVTNLEANTEYSFAVKVDCGNDDLSAMTATISGRTDCDLLALPHTFTFEADELITTSNSAATPALPWCSYRYVTPGATSYITYPYSYTSYPHAGSRALYFYGTTAAAAPDQMAWITPQVDVSTLPMNGNRVTFWARMQNTSYNKDVMVGTMSDPSDFSTFTEAGSVTVSGTTHTLYTVNLTSANATDAYVAIVVNKGNGGVYVDDLTLEEIPSCFTVTNLAASDVTTNSVTLTWSDEDNESVNGYTVSYEGGNPVVVTETTATIENLNPNTAYLFSVVANCSGTDAEAVTLTVNTKQQPATLPYSIDFENAEQNAQWTMVNGTNGWYMGTAATEEGNSLYVSNNNGETNDYTKNASTWSYAYRLVNIAEAGWHTFSMDWIANGESNYDYMRAWLAPADINLTAGSNPEHTSASQSSYRSTTPAGWIDLNPAGGKLNLSSSWNNLLKTFNVETAGQYNIVLMWANDNSQGNNPPAAVDNIVLKAKKSFEPANLTAENITAAGATLTWEADERNNGTETYTIMNGETVVAEGVSANNYNVALTANTDYNFSVFAVNGGENSEAENIGLGVYEYPTQPGKMVYVTGTILNSIGNTSTMTLYRGLGANMTEQANYTGSTYLTQNYTSYTTSNDWPVYGPMTVVFVGKDATAANTGVANLTVNYECPAYILSREAITVEENGAYTWTTVEGTEYPYENHSEVDNAADINRNFMDTVFNAGGCDSVYNTLTLTLHPDYRIALTDEFCEGTVYTIGEGVDAVEKTASFQGEVTLHSVHGADSVIVANIQMHPAPVAQINNKSTNVINTFCNGDQLVLNARSSMEGVNFLWDDQSSNAVRTVNPEGDVVYTLVAVDPTTGCQSVEPATVTVSATPRPMLSISSTVDENKKCNDGQELTLTVTDANTANVTFKWNNDQTGNSITVNPDVTTTYTVTTEGGCEVVSASNTVTIYPVYELNDEQNVCYINTPYVWKAGNQIANGNITENGNYDYTFQTVNGCDSTVHLTFAFEEMAVNNTYRAVCVGTEVTWGNETITATENTTLTYTLGVGEEDPDGNILDCPAQYNLVLTVNSNPGTTETVNACDSYTWQYMDEPLTEGNTYTVDYNDENGCAGVHTLVLAIHPTVYYEDFHQVCDAMTYTWLDGETYSLDVELSDGIVFKTAEDEFGCDTIAQLHLDMNYVTDTLNWENVAACDNYYVDVVQCNGSIERQYFTENNDYELRVRNAQTGRDQIRRIHLTITQSDHHTVVLKECVPFTWEYATGLFVEDINPVANDTVIYREVTNEGGCSVIETLRLKAKRASVVTTPVTLCQNGSWIDGNDVEYFAANYELGENEPVMWNAATNAAGCDSTDYVVFTLNPVYDVTAELTLCESEFENGAYTYVNPNNAEQTIELTIASEGLNQVAYTNTVTADWTTALGCDSVVTVTYTVNPTMRYTFVKADCHTYTWELNGTEYTESNNTDFVTIESAAGCDSIVTLDLTINETIRGYVDINACGEYTYEGVTYREDREFEEEAPVSVVTGCDSITVYRYHIIDRVWTDQYVIANAPYEWQDGKTYSVDNTTAYYDATGERGCDSIVVLHLIMEDPITICEGELPYTTSYGVTLTEDNGTGVNQYVDTVENTIYALTYTVKYNTVGIETVDNACDSYEWNGETYTESGTYTYPETLTNAVGCDSTATLQLTVNYSNTGDTTAVECGSFTWYENECDHSSDYVHTFTNVAGCDSVVTLHITIKENFTSSFEKVACDSYDWMNGTELVDTYTESIEKTQHFTAANGCDSAVTMYLTINNSVAVTIDTIVNAGSFTYNNVLYTAPYDYNVDGDIIANYAAENECDSVVTLHLLLQQGTIKVDTINYCGDYTWRNGKTYTWVPAGERVNPAFNYKERTAEGLVAVTDYPTYITYKTDGRTADSTYVLWLTLQEASVEYKTVDVLLSQLDVNGDITVDGLTFNFAAEKAAKENATRNEEHRYGSAYYCDSIIYYTFNLKYNYDTTALQYVCFENTDYNTLPTEVVTLVDRTVNAGTANEMVYTDSIYRRAAITGSVSAEACDSYSWNNQTYTSSNTYTQTLQSATGCDSVVTLTLTINKNNGFEETLTACDSIDWNGHKYYTSGDQTVTYTDANGCSGDSVLHLTIVNTVHNSFTEVACDSYEWHGERTATGIYTYDYANETNAICTNVDTLHLTINESKETLADSVKFGENYRLNGQIYTAPYESEAPDYDVFHLQTVDGCDSTAHVHITLNFYNDINETDDACGVYTWTRNGHTYRSITDEVSAQHNNALYEDITPGAEEQWVISNPVYTPAEGEANYGNRYHLQLSLRGALYGEAETTFLLSRGTMTYDGNSFDYSAERDAHQSKDVVETIRYGAIGNACDSILTLTVHLVNNYDTLANETVCYEQNTFAWTEASETLDLNEGSNEFTRTLNDGTDNEMVTTRTIIRSAAITGTQTFTNVCDSVQWNNTWYKANVVDEPVTIAAANQCDSIVTLNVTVVNTIHNVVDLTGANAVCDSYIWTDKDAQYTYTASTEDTWTRPNAINAQCSDVDTLKLTIKTKTYGVDEQRGCNSFTWTLNGETYTADENEATATLTNVAGCDSIVTLNLTMGYSNSYDSTLWISDGSYRYQYQDGHYQMLTASDNPYSFTEHYTNAEQCDSALNITIHVGNGYFAYDDQIACNSFTWVDGHTYTYTNEEGVLYIDEDGNPVTVAPIYYKHNENDYDSIYTLRLTLTQNTERDETIDFPISLRTLTYGGKSYTVFTGTEDQARVFEATTVEDVLHLDAVQYCDSIINLTINVVNNYSEAEVLNTNYDVTTYTWRGHSIDMAVDYDNVETYHIYDTIANADSLLTTVEYLTIVKHPIQYVTERRTECDSYTWVVKGDTVGTYTENTNQTRTFTDQYGADSVVTLMLIINHNSGHGIVETACNSYLWNGETYTESNDYYYNYIDANGCPSEDTLHLTVNQSIDDVVLDAVTACGSYEWIYEGTTVDTYTTSGDKEYTARDANNCEYTVTLPLTINAIAARVYDDPVTACDEYVWTAQSFNAETGEMEETVIATITETTASAIAYATDENGCPAEHYISLVTIRNSVSTTLGSEEAPIEACDSYEWTLGNGASYGDALTESNMYTATYTTEEVCNNFDTLYLTINRNEGRNQTVVECNSYTWNALDGNVYDLDESQTKIVAYTDVNGCSGFDTLNLTIGTGRTFGREDIVACDSYEWNGETFTESIETSKVLTNPATGCDSIAYLYLTINNHVDVEFSATACVSYTWADNDDAVYTESGDYTRDITDDNNCAATETLHLTINDVLYGIDEQTACDSFTWELNNETYTESTNEPTVTLSSEVTNCDSIVTLHLTLNHNSGHAIEWAACDSYEWNGTVYSEAGDYYYSYIDNNGCASEDTLHLTIANSVNNSVSATACDSYEWHGTTYEESGVYTYTYTTADNCSGSETLTLTINYSNTGVDVQTVCDTYTWIDGETYTESNNTATFTLTNEADCDSVVTLNLTVNQTLYATETAEVCGNYVWNGRGYTESTVDTYTTTGSNGCDSITTLNLMINQPTTGEETVTACSSYEWNGNVYTTSGDYPYNTTNVAGCDSVATLHLTVNQPVATAFSETVCGSEYTWNDVTYTVSGTYQQTFTAANECDSVVTLTLVINEPVDATLAVTACDSYEWNGNVYDQSGSYTRDITDANGCAAIETLVLTINESATSEATATACDSYEWNGTVYTTSGDYTFTTTGANGCDSIATLHLTVNVSTSGYEMQTACGSYEWNGTTYSETGVYSFSLTNAANCDSTATLLLTINNPVYNTVYETACNSYTWNNGDGMTYTESGSYPYTIEQGAANGCDSIVTLNLTVNNAQTVVLDAIAACDSYEWNGVTYTEGGELSFTTTGTNGCDSTTTVVLTINNSQTVALDAVATCNSFEWNGTVYTESGELSYTTQDVNGCDSTTTLSLTINGAIYSIDEQNACDSYTWIVNDEVIGTYTASTNEPTAILPAASGCDSIVTLNLTIRNSSTGVFEATACDSYTWALNGVSYTESNNTDAVTLVNVAGCDSTVTLNLTVNHSTEGEINVEAYDYYTWYGVTYTETPAEAPTHMFTNAAGCDSTLILNLTILHYDSITVILSVNDPVMGTTNPVAGTYRFYPGESVSATATPNGGYLFTGWVVNGDTASFANDVYIDVLPEMAGMTFNVVATFKADNVGIESVDYSNISIYSVDNKVIVKGAEGLTIYFYDVNGRCIERRANAAEIENFTVETSGVFLVKAGNAPAKRIVVIR